MSGGRPLLITSKGKLPLIRGRGASHDRHPTFVDDFGYRKILPEPSCNICNLAIFEQNILSIIIFSFETFKFWSGSTGFSSAVQCIAVQWHSPWGGSAVAQPLRGQCSGTTPSGAVQWQCSEKPLRGHYSCTAPLGWCRALPCRWCWRAFLQSSVHTS